MDLLRELARRADDQGARRAGLVEPLGLAEQARREGESKRDGLAGTGLGRDKEVAIWLGRENSGLNRRRFGIGARGEGSTERGMGSGERQGGAP